MPVIDRKQLEHAMRLIEEGKKHNQPLSGGQRIGEKVSAMHRKSCCGPQLTSVYQGCYVARTIFYQVPGDSPLAREEVFGPVVVIQSFQSEDQAVAMANDTQYGLYASVFTKDISRAIRISRACSPLPRRGETALTLEVSRRLSKAEFLASTPPRRTSVLGRYSRVGRRVVQGCAMELEQGWRA